MTGQVEEAAGATGGEEFLSERCADCWVWTVDG